MIKRIEIKKTYMGQDYSVWIDREPEGRPDFWVDPQYATIIADDETMTVPESLIEMVRNYINNPEPVKTRNIDAEIVADIEYTKHYNAVKKMMAE